MMHKISITLCVFGIALCTASTHAFGRDWSGFTQTGKASYYADKFEKRKTANGEIFRQKLLTAAHKKLPFGTRVKVSNIENGKTVNVRINDRGPFIKGRIIDLSKSAFKRIGKPSSGVLKVKIEVIQ